MHPSLIDPLTHPDIVSNIIPYLKNFQKEYRHLAKAARVNKAWNAIYTPILWQDVFFDCLDHNDDIRTAPGLDFRRHGVHVRRLEIANLDESHLHMIAVVPPPIQQDQEPQSRSSPCPNLKSLRLTEYKAPVEQLSRFLKSVRPTLQLFSFETTTIPAEDIVAALLAMSADDAAGNGYGSGLGALKTLKLAFDLFFSSERLSWDLLTRLLETFSCLETLDVCGLSLHAPPALITEEEEDDDDEEVEVDEGIGPALQEINLLQERRYNNITSLSLQYMRMDTRTTLRLLSMTPHLQDLDLESPSPIMIRNVIGALSTICPHLKRLSATCLYTIPPSNTVQLFQPAITTSISTTSITDGSCLHLEYLDLDRCHLDNSTLARLISTQADTLLELTLRACFSYTDDCVKAILSGCHRLTSLQLLGKSEVTLLRQEGDGSEPYDFLPEVKRKEWPCPTSLKRLVIRYRDY
ncbi:hypothetical protein BGW39_003867 [Mortierella sp. 14UC]|nr:hypothetical protein BGW39_003867 [Mortierella sp. 14UC]